MNGSACIHTETNQKGCCPERVCPGLNLDLEARLVIARDGSSMSRAAASALVIRLLPSVTPSSICSASGGGGGGVTLHAPSCLLRSDFLEAKTVIAVCYAAMGVHEGCRALNMDRIAANIADKLPWRELVG